MKVWKGLLLSFLITVLGLFVMAFLLYRFGMEDSLEQILIFALYWFSTFCGALLTGHLMGKRRFLWGLFVGLLYFILLFLLSLLAESLGLAGAGNILYAAILSLSGGLLGGIASR